MHNHNNERDIRRINIPDNANVLSLGNYMLARSVYGMTSELAKKLDDVLSSLKLDGIRQLGTALQVGSKHIFEVSEYHINKKGTNVLNSDAIKEAGRYSTYKNYLDAVVMKPMDVLSALSQVNKERGDEMLKFKYEEGIIMVKVDNKYVDPSFVVKQCEEFFWKQGKKVEVRYDTKLEKYARKLFDNPDMQKNFINSPDKVVNDISLSTMSKLAWHGRFTGKPQGGVPPEPMDRSLKGHLSSDSKTLMSFYTTIDDVSKINIPLDKSHIFFKDGLDSYGLGVKKNITAALIKRQGLDPETTDETARAVFDRYMEAGGDVGKNDVLLFNPAWIAEAFSKCKNNADEKKKFEAKYRKMLCMTPKYVGVGTFRYVLKKARYDKPLKSDIFMTIPNIAEKIVAYHCLASNIFEHISLGKFVTRMFAMNRSDGIRGLALDSLELALDKFDFEAKMVGVKKSGEDLWLDFERELLNEKGDNIKEDPYVVDYDNWEGGSVFTRRGRLTVGKNDNVGNSINIVKIEDVQKKEDEKEDNGYDVVNMNEDALVNVPEDDREKVLDSYLKSYNAFFTKTEVAEGVEKRTVDKLFLQKMMLDVIGREECRNIYALFMDPVNAMDGYDEENTDVKHLILGFFFKNMGEYKKKYGKEVPGWVDKYGPSYEYATNPIYSADWY